MPQEIHLISRTKEFIHYITAGVGAWMKAGEVLAEIVEEEGLGALHDIQLQCPGLSRSTLEIFLSIGRREIYPMLAWNPTPGAERLARLSYDQQERYYAEGVPVVEGDSNGVEIIAVAALTHRQCLQVFDGCLIRSERQQSNWLQKEERERMARQSARSSLPKPKYRPPSHGDMTGFDADTAIVRKSAMSLDELAAATPLELLKSSLDQAHLSLVEARRYLEKVKKNSRADDFITAGLNSVGNLRFAVNNGEL